MSEPEEIVTRLWTEAGFIDDVWTHAESAEALTDGSRIIVPLNAFLELDETVRAEAAARIGVLVAPAEPVDALLSHLETLPLIALAFPAFNDGRSFSKAELLRRRHDYAGRLRATGEVLIDQVPHMLRTGFDELEVSNPVALARLAEGHTAGLGRYYQPTAKPAASGPAYSWRRLAG